MRKHLTAIAVALLCATNIQASDRKDDDNPGGWDFDLPSLKLKKTTREFEISVSSSFSFGFIGGINQAKDVSIDMGQSFEMEWGDVLNLTAHIGKKDFIDIGLGFDWRNYRVTDFKRFAKDEQGIISMQDYPEGTEPKFSRIHTFSLSVPVKYFHPISKNVTFGIGPELYFTPHASLKTRYYEDGEKKKITGGNVHQNRFSVGVGAELIIWHVGIYYKYNPFPVLRSSYGPKFSSMTTGIKIGF